MPAVRRATAVIPARDEAGAIGAVVAAATAVVAEVIVVDDGSRDATAALADAAGARVVRLSPGRGKGFALRSGVAAASHDRVVLCDGDGQDDPADIPLLLDALDQGADLAIGTRFSGPIDVGAVTPVDRLGNRALTELLNLLYGVRLTDTQAGFRAFRGSLWTQLPLAADGFAVETEVLVRALQAGAAVTEIPVGRLPRAHGERVLHRVRDGLAILGCMLRLRLSLG